MNKNTRLAEEIEATLWLDTHEHTVEERHRLEPGTYRFRADGVLGEEVGIPQDWTALILDYTICDLLSAGLPETDVPPLFAADLGPAEKWDLVEPYWADARHGGYAHAVDLTTESLCGARLSRETCAEIDEQLRALRSPGYYRWLLSEKAKVSRCQVHTVDHDPFCESEYPDLLNQDISIVPLITGEHATMERESGIEVSSLDDYLSVVEYCFDRYGEDAVAVKCVWAYRRTLLTQLIPEPPAESFLLLREGRATDEQQREVEDFLFDVCVRLATERGLPMKIHVGTLDGNNRPEILHVREHAHAAMTLAQRYPTTQFVFMHMAWPHQEELMAVAKHQPNANVDLCWAWILAPAATRAFLTRFLTTVPVNKLLCFGGDYLIAENIVGHAAVARSGLRLALEDLVDDGWLTLEDACALVPKLMHGNAERIFGSDAEQPSQS